MLWKRLLSLEHESNLSGNIFNTQAGVSIHQLDEQFYWEDQQINIFDYMGKE